MNPNWRLCKTGNKIPTRPAADGSLRVMTQDGRDERAERDGREKRACSPFRPVRRFRPSRPHPRPNPTRPAADGPWRVMTQDGRKGE